jgi:lipopolysaccharide/colanic/teichoic acid biosynthesis glycosyltransferase
VPDLLVVLLTAPLWLALLGGVAVLVRLNRKASVLPPGASGLYGRLFDLIKFRTMTDARHAQGPAPGRRPVDSIRRWLRSTSWMNCQRC